MLAATTKATTATATPVETFKDKKGFSFKFNSEVVKVIVTEANIMTR